MPPTGPQIGHHRFAADHGLADRDQRPDALGQIESVRLPNRIMPNRVAGLHVSPSRSRTGCAARSARRSAPPRSPPVRQADRDRVALVLCRLVDAGVEEGPWR